MSWKKQDSGNWQFICHPNESYKESLIRCMNTSTYTAKEGDWLAVLALATDIIAKKLNPSGTEAPPGASFQSGSQGSYEVRSQNNE
ncbi:hypothetical protein IMT69_002115 [Salmonella enterica]|nr:hypothetical protein [Salmonella enterica]EGL7282676.1 hypothetical protein [Salmonella enterica]EGM5504385.1 hypothetical protein [Salmonella enterica]EGM5523162.1 hypothetical protein [Salmonella enterica]EHK6449995.1 hypothetical protein [Salmonella enterica]